MNGNFTFEQLKDAFLSGYNSGVANGYACTPDEEFEEYLKELEWEAKQNFQTSELG